MSQIASKNMYELLGNDPELDPDRPADPPTKAIDKPTARLGKRDGGDAPRPARDGFASQNRTKQTDGSNENTFRDRGIGADKNRSRGSGETVGNGPRGGQRGRGGRGGRGGARGGGDRHSRTGINDHEKQVAHGWGGTDGDAELADEQAGQEIAKLEESKTANDAAEADNQPEPEPEDKSKSYAAYLVEQAERKLSLSASNVRKPNEGSSKKFPEGTALNREEEEEAYFAGSGGKAKRERARKEKVHVELDGDRMLAPPPREGGSRGGRGGRGRGEFRGGEGRGRGGGEYRGGEGRGRGEGRGEGRGGRGRGEGRGDGRGRGEGRGRGGRGGGQSGPNITDSSAFPSLGA